MTLQDALRDAARRLEAISGTARLDAELLMAHALGVSREDMLLGRTRDPPPPCFGELLARRLAHEPVAYITGRRAFWTIELEVGPGALIPRPDSETLIETALEHFDAAGPATILDLGTGPGTLLLAALDQWPEARGLGIDASAEALAYARRNAARLGMAGRAELRRGDWADGVEGRFDLILCNPPYIEDEAALAPGVVDWEPAAALFGGPDGLALYRLLAPRLSSLLAPGGALCLEIGAGMEEAVGALLTARGFTTKSRRDLKGIVRCLIATADED